MFQNFSHHRWLSEPSHLQMKRHSYWALLAAVLLIGAWIRIWGLGSLDEILFEGHEANYLIYYRHLDQPNVGDTANYPAMQWWWYLWGFVTPKTNGSALFISIGVGLSSIVLMAESLRRLTHRTWPALMLGLLLSTHPLHTAWSTSIYNVMPPFFFIGLGLFFLTSQMQNTLRSILVGICLGVAIGMRIEVGVIGLVFIGLCLYLRCTARHVILLMLVTGLTALLLTAQTLFVNEIPGSGEHLLALAMNLSLDDYWAPYSVLMLVYLSFHVVLFEPRNRWHFWWSGIFYLLAAHFFLSSFNDYGSRHTVPSLLVLLTMCAMMRPWWVAPACVVVLQLPALSELYERYQIEPEDFAVQITKEYPNLSIDTAYSEPCALINENQPFAQEPVLSHFNLWETDEFDRLTRVYGCVNWCMDWNDWRWSSLGVHDRATRLKHLYQTSPVSHLKINGSECVLFRLHR